MESPLYSTCDICFKISRVINNDSEQQCILRLFLVRIILIGYLQIRIIPSSVEEMAEWALPPSDHHRLQ